MVGRGASTTPASDAEAAVRIITAASSVTSVPASIAILMSAFFTGRSDTRSAAYSAISSRSSVGQEALRIPLVLQAADEVVREDHDSSTAFVTGAWPAVQGAGWSLIGVSTQVAQDFCD